MKNLLILATLLSSALSYGVTLPVTVGLVDEASRDQTGIAIMALSTTSVGISTTAAFSPVGGLVIFADSDVAILDLNNEVALEEVELIQMAIEDGEELTDFQNAILEIGITNSQLDENANILE
jgi:hypothetical protein